MPRWTGGRTNRSAFASMCEGPAEEGQLSSIGRERRKPSPARWTSGPASPPFDPDEEDAPACSIDRRSDSARKRPSGDQSSQNAAGPPDIPAGPRRIDGSSRSSPPPAGTRKTRAPVPCRLTNARRSPSGTPGGVVVRIGVGGHATHLPARDLLHVDVEVIAVGTVPDEGDSPSLRGQRGMELRARQAGEGHDPRRLLGRRGPTGAEPLPACRQHGKGGSRGDDPLPAREERCPRGDSPAIAVASSWALSRVVRPWLRPLRRGPSPSSGGRPRSAAPPRRRCSRSRGPSG